MAILTDPHHTESPSGRYGKLISEESGKERIRHKMQLDERDRRHRKFIGSGSDDMHRIFMRERSLPNFS